MRVAYLHRQRRIVNVTAAVSTGDTVEAVGRNLPLTLACTSTAHREDFGRVDSTVAALEVSSSSRTRFSVGLQGVPWQIDMSAWHSAGPIQRDGLCTVQSTMGFRFENQPHRTRNLGHELELAVPHSCRS